MYKKSRSVMYTAYTTCHGKVYACMHDGPCVKTETIIGGLWDGY